MVKENLITVKDVAELLNVTVWLIRRWARTGKIPCIKVGRQFRFRLSEIEPWLESKRIVVEEEDE